MNKHKLAIIAILVLLALTAGCVQDASYSADTENSNNITAQETVEEDDNLDEALIELDELEGIS